MTRFAVLLAAVAAAPALLSSAPAPELAALLRSPDHRKVRVSDPVSEQLVRASGGQLAGDYGGFRLYVLPENAVGQITNILRTDRADLALEDDTIHLNAVKLQTRRAEVQAARQPVAEFEGRRLHLVQFAGPVRREWVRTLWESGAQIVAAIPSNAFLLYADAKVLRSLQNAKALEGVLQWDGALQDDWKIARSAKTTDERGQERVLAGDYFAVQLVQDSGVNEKTLQLIDSLKRDRIFRDDTVLHYRNIVVRLRAEDVAQLAARPDVVSVALYRIPKRKDERQNIILTGAVNASGQPTGPGYLAWLASKGFTQGGFDASNIVVDVADSGLDNGTTSPNHFGLYVGGVIPGESRVVYSRTEGSPGSSLGRGVDGHGTLNTHIIAGYSDRAGAAFADGAGYRFGLGVAPFVRVGASVIFDPNFTFPTYRDMLARAYRDGARISSNSWGAAVAGEYDIDAQQYDTLVRDAQQTSSAITTAGNQEMVILFSAGNDGPGASTIGSPGTAKNVFTIGAAENVQPFGGTFGGADGCGTDDSGANSANDVIDFSSRGPCTDGRTKPDLQAPGTHILGGVWQVANPAATGTASPLFDASGVCGGLATFDPMTGELIGVDAFFPNTQQFYTSSSGTSHSCPAVAGGAALLRQWFLTRGLTAPSPAMTKAWLMNSARYMTGAFANDTLPSNSQGMGMMNLGLAFDGTPRIVRDQLSSDVLTATGQQRSYRAQIASTAKPVRVTLAWTEPPGSTIGNAYVNNLDLTVTTAGGTVYKGNVFSGAASTTGGAADVRNNVESVFLPAGTSGVITVTVTATNLLSDGLPGNTQATDQDFALVVYNADVAAPAADIQVTSTALAAESIEPANAVISPGELVTVSLFLRNSGGADATNVIASLRATGGVLEPSASQAYGPLVVGGAAFARNFTFTAANTSTCTPITATWDLFDGSTSLGTVSVTFATSSPTIAFTQNFDGVTPPTLPSGWSSASTGAMVNWVTSTAQRDSLPNAAFAAGATAAGTSALTSPSIAIASASATLTFRHSYDFDRNVSGTRLYDGGVLEIKIGSGAFTEILAAGGTFLSGGYTGTLWSGTGNPLGGQRGWGLSSSGFVTTVAQLPANAAGQNVQFRWRFGSDSSVASNGWYLDSLSLQDGSVCSSALVDLNLTQTASAPLVGAGATFSYSLTVTNAGPQIASGVVLSDALPSGITFVSATPSQGTVTRVGNSLTAALGAIPSGSSATLVVTVIAPGIPGILTNNATVTAIQTDAAAGNNQSSLVVQVSTAIDSDGDGIPDSYETANGLNPNNAGDANGDLDGDGQTNLAEYLAGTAANDPNSRLRITSQSFASGRYSLGFPSVTGKAYIIERTADFVTWVTLAGNVTGTGGTINYTDNTVGSGTRYFYRIRLKQP
ncbi:MAG: S8 family serine peptidase [Verrucomicrobia bacterium]|nr:S8 family serine peptidase [Verrucomicrobiota bacterium]